MLRIPIARQSLTVLVSLLLAGGCGASPTASPPAPHPRREAIETPQAQPWIEISRGERGISIIGHAPDGGERYSVHVDNLYSAIAAPDGGACLIVDAEKGSDRLLQRLDQDGHLAWKRSVPFSQEYRLVFAGKWLHAIGLYGAEPSSPRESEGDRSFFTTLDEATGREANGLWLPSELTDAALNGDFLAVAGGEQVALRTQDRTRLWSVQARMFPTTEPTSRMLHRKVAVNAEGTVLTGAADGSVLAIRRDGTPLYQLGVRGPVSRIEARADGDFVVRAAGRATVIGPGGVVRAEIADSAEPSTPTGIVDRRILPAPPSSRTSLAHRVERAGPEGKPLEKVVSVAALAPNDVWALDSAGDRMRLYHFDGRAWTDAGTAEVKFPREVYVDGQPPAESSLVGQRLARGPKGTLQVFGLRAGNSGTRLCLLEYMEGKLRERLDLLPVLRKTPVSGSVAPVYAVSPKGREVLCGYAPMGCVEAGPGISPRNEPESHGETIPGLEIGSGPGLSPRLFVGETLWKIDGVATPSGDIFGLARGHVLHVSDGQAQAFSTPIESPRSVWATSTNDVWVAGDDQLAHFDGKRWWRILGANGEVTGSGADDVWVWANELWHITPDPLAKPDIEGVAALAPQASLPSAPLRIAGVDAAYRLERVAIDIDGTSPLRTAVGVAKSPGGALWFHEGSRVVEYDGARARVIYEAPKPQPFHCWPAPQPDCGLCTECTQRLPLVAECQQCVAPTATGAGAMLVDRAWQWATSGGVVKPRDTQISSVLAIAASPSGAVWAVSADQEQQSGVLIQGPSGHRFLTGLPPAAYNGMAIRADDDAWLAGGLTTVWSSGQVTARAAGEGTLVHFDGRTFTRSRGPDGALFAVAAVGPNEAWAVGLDGGVLHQKGDTSEPFHLEREDGTKLIVFLTCVAAGGPGEIFLSGEGSVLLRWDGSVLRRLDTTAAGRDAPFSAVVAPAGTKPGWVVGPGGIWKVMRVSPPGDPQTGR